MKSRQLGFERELANVRGEIESTQVGLNYLKNRTSISTLKVTFFVEGEKAFGFLSKAGEGLKKGWKNLQRFFIFLVNLWPVVLIFGALLFWILKRKKTTPHPY